MTRWLLDGDAITSFDDVHDSVVASGLAPVFYGRNRDALFDLLTSGTLEIYVLQVSSLLVYAEDLVPLLLDAATENPALTLVIHPPDHVVATVRAEST